MKRNMKLQLPKTINNLLHELATRELLVLKYGGSGESTIQKATLKQILIPYFEPINLKTKPSSYTTTHV